MRETERTLTTKHYPKEESSRESRREKFYRQVVDASGPGGDEGRGVAAISPGEVPSNH